MIVTPPMPVKTATNLEPAAPRRRPGRAVTALSTRRALRAAPAPSTIGSIVVARRDDDRCEHRSGSLRCVRGPHLDSPQAHVLVAGAPDPHRVRVPGGNPGRTPGRTPGRGAARVPAPAASPSATTGCA